MVKKFFNRIKNSSDSKGLLTNFFSLSFLQIAGYIFPFITLPYLSRTIGVQKFGDIAFANAIMVYFSTLVDFGFIYSSVRDIARCRTDKSKVSRIFSSVMWSRLFLVVISFVFLSCLIFIVPTLFDKRILLYLTFIQVLGHALFPEWMFQGLEKMIYISIFNVSIKLFFTVCVFFFIKSPEDYLYQPLLMGIGFLLSGISSLIVLHRMGYRWEKPSFSRIANSLRTNFDLFLNQLVPNLYNSLSVLLLGFFHGSTANGIFDAGNKFNTIASQFQSVLSRTFYPFLSRRINKHSLYAKLNITFSLIVSIILFLFAPILIKIFFTDEFASAVVILRIMSISLIFLSLSNIYGTNYLIVIGQEKLCRNISLYSSLIGFLVAVPLVYYYSFLGAAITIVLSRGIMAITLTLKAYKFKKK